MLQNALHILFGRKVQHAKRIFKYRGAGLQEKVDMPFSCVAKAERTVRIIARTATDNVLLREKRRGLTRVCKEAAEGHMTQRALSPKSLTREKKPGFPDTMLDGAANTAPLQ
jgi:hypothetical protein